jgi:RNA polymerase-binding protein DksA
VRKQVKSASAKGAAKPKAAKLAAKTAPAKPARPAKAAVKQVREVPASRDLKKFRDLLLAERARLQAELEEIEQRTSRATLAERATELSSYEDHPADLASETFEREKDIAIAESVESLLNQVDTALEKVERGTYGTCDACGRPIKKARLQALPFATLCLECQGRLES